MLGFLGSGVDASILRFPSMLATNTPTGGDLGAHVLLPQILRDDLLPAWMITGWSDAAFAGFPVLTFYFPLPMLVAALGGWLIPSGVALKIVVSAGLIALPPSGYALVRSMGLDRLIAAVAASGAAAFVFMESYDIFGGNIKSTLAGEFSFSWSLTLAVIYLALVSRDVRGGGVVRPWPGVVLAAVTLSHVVSTIVVVAVAIPWLFRRASARTVVASWLVGFGLTAFWSIPFLVRVLQGLTTDMAWEAVTGVVGGESPLPLEFVPAVLAAVGAVVWSVKRRTDICVLVSLAAVALGGYVVLPLVGVGVLNNGRLLPYWYLAVYLLAGIGVGAGVVALGRRRPGSIDGSVRYAMVAVLLVAFSTLLAVRDVPHWVAWDFTGYEGKQPYAEYEALMDAIDELPPGRIMWEESVGMEPYGTQLALMLFPYWSPEHPSMAGVYQESSLTTPFNLLNASEVGLEGPERISGLRYHPMDFDRGIAHLGVYGVSYYVSFTEEAAAAAREAGLESVADAGPWVVFALPESGLVETARFVPSVWSGDAAFSAASLDWYDDVDRLDEWLTADGPGDWPRVDTVTERDGTGAIDIETADGTVSDVVIDGGQISFRTTAVGVPHLVKVSYFPNWSADGALGPYRAAPSLMVVVPTEESVSLEFARTWVEYLGIVVTIGSLLSVVAWGVMRSRNRRSDETAP